MNRCMGLDIWRGEEAALNEPPLAHDFFDWDLLLIRYIYLNISPFDFVWDFNFFFFAVCVVFSLPFDWKTQKEYV